MVAEGETLDAIAGGRIRLIQRQAGYRFNIDAVFLARFALLRREAERSTHVVDLGTGCGIVALLMALWRPSWTVAAIEVQASLAGLARRNAELNALPVAVTEGDWRQAGDPGAADLVVCNPPYFVPDRGQPCSDDEKSAARQELNGTIEDMARAVRRLLRPRGVVRVIHASSRLPELMTALRSAGVPAVRLRFVHPKAEDPAYAVLVEGIADSRSPLVVEPPLVVHGPDGQFSPEVVEMLAPDA